MRVRSLSLLAVLGALACASGGGAGSGDAGGGDQITIVVSNEFTMGVTAFAVWEGNRVRLGEVSAGRTRTFTTVRRSDRIAVGLQVTGAPPGSTSAGPRRFGGGVGTDPDPSSPYVRSEPIDIAAGDGIEWTLDSTGVVVYRRLSAADTDATRVGPQ